MPTPYIDPAVRFWRLVDKSGPNGCWLWMGDRNNRRGGYGRFWYKGRNIQAHRFALFLATGSMGHGLQGCHRCDNPPCVRPDHLFWGTQSENIQDALGKDRLPTGQRNHAAKLTPEQVRWIRENPEGLSQVKMGKRLGVTTTAVNYIVNGRNWRHSK